MKKSACEFIVAAALVFAPGAKGQIEVLAVGDSATFTPGLPSGGSLASLFCTGLTAIEGIQTFTAYPLPYEIAGVTVAVSGVAAPLLAVANLGGYQQINFQVPGIASPPPSQTIEVSWRGQTGRIEWQAPTAWGVFFMDASGYAVVQHVDESLVTQDHPAQPGEVLVVYATNLDSFGNISGAPQVIGYPAQAVPLPSLLPSRVGDGLRIAPSLNVNDRPAELLYSGLTPGSVGVFQVNFRVPESTPDGDAVLTAVRGTCLAIGGCGTITSQDSRTAKVAVRAAGAVR